MRFFGGDGRREVKFESVPQVSEGLVFGRSLTGNVHLAQPMRGGVKCEEGSGLRLCDLMLISSPDLNALPSFAVESSAKVNNASLPPLDDSSRESRVIKESLL